MLQCLHHSCTHGLVVFLRIADVGEYLCEGEFVVYLYEALVFGQGLLVGIYAVDVGVGILVIVFAMHHAFEWEAVGALWVFIWPSYGDGCHGERELWQAQRLDDAHWVIYGSAEIAGAESEFLRKGAEVLREQQRIAHGIDEREEIVVSWCRLTLVAPLGEAVEIGAEGYYYWGRGYHRLVEMMWGECFLAFLRTGYHGAVELYVAHGCCSGGSREQFVENLRTYVVVFVFAYSFTLFDCHKYRFIVYFGDKVIHILEKKEILRRRYFE